MDILWKDYKIECDEYSYNLFHKQVFTQKEYDKVVKMRKGAGVEIKKNVGDVKWVDLGFYVNLDSLLNQIVRKEMENDNTVMPLEGFIDKWEGMMSTFARDVKVVKEGVKNEI